MSGLHDASLEHFRIFGWVRIAAAFSANDAARMCDVIWAGLAKKGIHQHDRSTWTRTRPEHRQHLKQDPVFRAIGSTENVPTRGSRARCTSGRSTTIRAEQGIPGAVLVSRK